MNIRLHRAIHDHHSAHRKQAIRALERKADAQDDEPISWLLLALVCAFALAVAFALNIHEIIGGL